MRESYQITVLGDDLIEKSIDINSSHQEQIMKIKSKIDLNNTSAMQYGIVSQNQLGTFSEVVLAQMRSENTIGIDTTLETLVSELRNFDRSISRWSILRLFESTEKRIHRINSGYKNTEEIIFDIECELEKQHKKLSVDLKVLEKMFEENKQHFENLSLYIYAGESRIEELCNNVLPSLKIESVEKNDEQLKFEIIRLEKQIERLKKRIQDLKLSKIVSMQLASQIRLIEQNNTLLLDKLQSCRMNTLPLWKNQMILSLNIAKTQQILRTQYSLSGFFNKILRRNNKSLQNVTSQITRDNEREEMGISTLQDINRGLLSNVYDVLNTEETNGQIRKEAETNLLLAKKELQELISED